MFLGPHGGQMADPMIEADMSIHKGAHRGEHSGCMTGQAAGCTLRMRDAWLDGEIRTTTPVSFTVVPGALRVLVPGP